MSYFDTLKDDIMDSIFTEFYESLYLELETTIELWFNRDWIDDTWGYPFVYNKKIILLKNLYPMSPINKIK